MSVAETEYYDLLGVETNASQRDIKMAFHKNAMKYHPDKNPDPDAAEKFKEIKEAYEILSDEDKRAKYNSYGASYFTEQGGRGGMDASDIFSAFFGGGGGGGGRARSGPRRTKDLVHYLHVTLEDLYNGTTKQMKVTRKKLCEGCEGTGTKDGQKPSVCTGCGGSGAKVAVRRFGNMMTRQQVQCDECDGEGEAISRGNKCTACHGAKTIEEKKILKVEIDKGMKEGKKIAFTGESNEQPGCVTGDVIFILKELEHKTFKRERDVHLYMEKDIPLVNALTGYSFNVTHLDGRVINVTTPHGDIIQHGDLREVVEEGMPVYGSPFTRGSMYVKFNVVFPDSLSDKQIASLRQNLPGDKSESAPDDATPVELEEIDPERLNRRYASPSSAYNESSSDEEGGMACQQQ